MDPSWVPAATINKTAPVSRPVLINSASDVFLCVYLTCEKELEDKRFPPQRKQRVYRANKTRLNRTADCHYRPEAPGHRIRCRPKDRIISVRLPAETENFTFSKAPGQAVGPAKPHIQGVPGLFPRTYSGRGVRLTNSLLMPRFIMRAPKPPLPDTVSARAQGQLYLPLFSIGSLQMARWIAEQFK
jgi:hypothetical protein